MASTHLAPLILEQSSHSCDRREKCGTERRRPPAAVLCLAAPAKETVQGEMSGIGASESPLGRVAGTKDAFGTGLSGRSDDLLGQ
jgi:hypothetical protein